MKDFTSLVEYIRSRRSNKGNFSTRQDRSSAQKRKAVLSIINFLASTETVDNNSKPSDKESPESYQLRSFFCKLQPSKFTNEEVDKYYKGFKEMFPGK